MLELLFSRDEPIEFIRQELTFDLPKGEKPAVFFETLGREQEIRLWLIRHMQNQMLPIPLRMMAMAHALTALDEALSARDESEVDRLLRGQRRIKPLQATELFHWGMFRQTVQGNRKSCHCEPVIDVTGPD